MPKCARCGKVLKNVFALKIHVGRMHKKGKALRVVKPVAPAGLEVSSLAVDELVALKQQVDGRLAEVARRLRLAGVMGSKPGPRPGRRMKAPAAKAAAVKKGVFAESATEMILRLLAGGKAVSTTEIAAAWRKAGRKGKPSKTLSDMVKAKKIKREELKGTRANNYRLA